MKNNLFLKVTNMFKKQDNKTNLENIDEQKEITEAADNEQGRRRSCL